MFIYSRDITSEERIFTNFLVEQLLGRTLGENDFLFTALTTVCLQLIFSPDIDKEKYSHILSLLNMYVHIYIYMYVYMYIHILKICYR